MLASKISGSESCAGMCSRAQSSGVGAVLQFGLIAALAAVSSQIAASVWPRWLT